MFFEIKVSPNRMSNYFLMVLIISMISCSLLSTIIYNEKSHLQNESDNPEKTCGSGWVIRLVGVEEEIGSDGWKHVTAWVAFENINAPLVGRFNDTPGYDLPNWGGTVYRGVGQNMTVVSSEGYIYDAHLDFETLDGGYGSDWVPPGFRYRILDNAANTFGYPYIWFRAAENASDLVIETDCGNLDIDNTSYLTFPAENINEFSYLEIGDSIELPEGILTITNVDPNCSDAKRPNYDSSVCIDLEFNNENLGYESDPLIEISVIDNYGVLYLSCGTYLVAGPGQAKAATASCATYGDKNRVAILSRRDSIGFWLINVDNSVAVYPTPFPSTSVFIEAGNFIMGSNNGNEDVRPIHTVNLDAYSIDQTEVTNAQYEECVNAGVCDPPKSGVWTKNYFGNPRYGDHPVIRVSWYDANIYCAWRGARLPTEAEWEKAARGGLENKEFPWGNEGPVCKKGAENGANFSDCDSDYTEPVGSYGANGYGLYDMAGNVAEWVSDLYAADYYKNSPSNNPTGSESGSRYVWRGGSWVFSEERLRTAFRNWDYPDNTSDSLGFRCANSP